MLIARTATVTLVLILGSAGGACSSGDDKPSAGAATTQVSAAAPSTIAPQVLQAKASTLTDQLIAGDYEAVTKEFNADMASGLPPENLKTAWQQVEAQYGKYQSRGTTAKSLAATPQGVAVFDTPMTFAKKAMKSRISFDPDGHVAGLFILEASAT